MQLISKILTPLLGVIGVLLTILTIFDFDEKVCDSCWPVDLNLYFTYILLGLATLMAVVGGVVNAVMKPGTMKGSLIGIGTLLVVFFISYGMASDQVMSYFPDDVSVTEVLWSGIGLYMLYILFIGAIGSIVFSWIFGLIRK